MKHFCLLLLLLAAAWAPARAGRTLDKVTLAGRDLRGRSFSGVTLTEVDLRRADLRQASFRGAFLWEVDLRGAHLAGADFRGAVYDEFTRWPAGFDPRKHGARLDD
jgi:uncharacterized protein YjbI with pentapeptide repeats